MSTPRRKRDIVSAGAALCIVALMVLLFVPTALGAADALPDFLKATDSPARILVGGSPLCSAPETEEAVALVEWRVLSLDTESNSLNSAVRLVVPDEIVASVNPQFRRSAPLDTQFEGEFRIVANFDAVDDPFDIPPVVASEVVRNPQGLVSQRFDVESTVLGESRHYPFDTYSLDSSIRLLYIEDDRTTAFPLAILFDCLGVSETGFEIAANGVMVDDEAEPRAMVTIVVARGPGGRIALLAVVVVALAIGWFAHDRTNALRNGQLAALLAAVSALALIQVRPVIVPEIVGVWTITDGVLYLSVAIACGLLILPSFFGARDGGDDDEMSGDEPACGA